jgi:DNA-binding response OmpR family regulator
MNIVRMKVLCIEDDPTIQTLVTQSLRDFNIIQALTLKNAEVLLERNSFDAILLDIELPDGDGLKYYTKLSQDLKYRKIPTLILTGHNDISNKLMAFSVGVDDFISKPFDPLELSARLSSKIKKAQSEIEEKKLRKIGDLEIDFDRQKVFHIKDGKEIDLQLTSIEIKILSLLTRRVEQVFSREQILNNVWGDTNITDRTVDSHIAHLRNKIVGSNVKIDTAKNFGYSLVIKN